MNILERLNNKYDIEKKFVIAFDNGQCMYADKTKYGSRISFIFKNEENVDNYKYIDVFCNHYDCNKVSVMYGRYWKSGKGAACFTPTTKEEASHVLVKGDWGGAFYDTRGRYLDDALESVYQYRYSSGRGIGVTYYVVPKEVFEKLL